MTPSLCEIHPASFRPVGVWIARAPVFIWGIFMVAQVREFRRKAELCRRAASIPTSGSGNADRILLALAEQLERDAALRERQLQKDVSDRPPNKRPAL
jgi:hypothetical protein